MAFAFRRGPVVEARLAGERRCWAGLSGAKTLLAGLVLGLATSSFTGNEAATPADQEAIARVVRAHVGSGRSADDQPIAEHPKFRRIVFGSDEGGRSLMAVQFTIETGNNWNVFIAVVDRPTSRAVAEARVGGKAYRSVTLRSLDRGLLKVDAEYYGGADPLCCPTVQGSSSFEVRPPGLWETDVRVGTRKLVK